MYMHYDYCPRCQGIRSTTLSVSLKKKPSLFGGKTDLLVFNYHCDTCLAFIRSQEKEMYGEIQFSGLSPYLP